MTVTRGEIAALLGVADTADDGAKVFVRVSALETATADAIVFAQDAGLLERALASAAGLILAPVGSAGRDARLLQVPDPRWAFAVCWRRLRPATGRAARASDRGH